MSKQKKVKLFLRKSNSPKIFYQPLSQVDNPIMKPSSSDGHSTQKLPLNIPKVHSLQTSTSKLPALKKSKSKTFQKVTRH